MRTKSAHNNTSPYLSVVLLVALLLSACTPTAAPTPGATTSPTQASAPASEPVTVTVSCPAPQKTVSPFLTIGLVAGLGLMMVGAWLLVRSRRAWRAVASPA